MEAIELKIINQKTKEIRNKIEEKQEKLVLQRNMNKKVFKGLKAFSKAKQKHQEIAFQH